MKFTRKELKEIQKIVGPAYTVQIEHGSDSIRITRGELRKYIGIANDPYNDGTYGSKGTQPDLYTISVWGGGGAGIRSLYVDADLEWNEVKQDLKHVVKKFGHLIKPTDEFHNNPNESIKLKDLIPIYKN